MGQNVGGVTPVMKTYPERLFWWCFVTNQGAKTGGLKTLVDASVGAQKPMTLRSDTAVFRVTWAGLP